MSTRVLMIWVAMTLSIVGIVYGTTITMKNGSQFEGRFEKRGTISDAPLKTNPNAAPAPKLIVNVDNGLYRVFVTANNVTAMPEEKPPAAVERIKIPNPVATMGRKIGSLGQVMQMTPFNEFGRRVMSIATDGGRLDVIQGITEINPKFTIIEGMQVQARNSVVCEMRIATSSLPRQTIEMILRTYLPQDNFEERARAFRLFTQAERYEDAYEELKQLLIDFPDQAQLKQHVTTLQQLRATRFIREIENRKNAGQHQLAMEMLNRFPAEGVAGETLIRVRDMLADYERKQAQAKQVIELIEAHRNKIGDAELKKKVGPICEEMKTELNIFTLDRFSDYLRLADDDKITPEQKLSIAIGGWLLGSGGGGENLAVSASLVTIRDSIVEYLRTAVDGDREQIIEGMRSQEGNTPNMVAKLIANMKPPLETKADYLNGIGGLLEMTLPESAERPRVNYYIQLPPEYSPYKSYPCIVTLANLGVSELNQIDWWTGLPSPNSGLRMGQAARHGYIVIAPVWSQPDQDVYGYSAREHSAVLRSLRDATKRFSIDTDRVYLSGHSVGAEAAWDIALAHPDLWCGVIPIVPSHDKYIRHYHENGKRLPMYFIFGEMDGRRIEENGPQLDRYLRHPGYDCTVIEYIGRGHENFHDDIQNVFTWMGTIPRRDFFPPEFECDSMRITDNFFWGVELENFPQNSIVAPELFGQSTKSRPAKTKFKKAPGANKVNVESAAGKVTVWLAPEIVNFADKVGVSVDGKPVTTKTISPSVEVILEDVRTRGDRQHPFWAKVSSASKRK